MIDFIKTERKNKKVSVKKLSMLSGVKATTIRNWEYGIAIPTLDNFQKVLNALGFELRIVGRDVDIDQ